MRLLTWFAWGRIEMGSLREEIARFRQPDGLVSPKRDPEIDSTGNGLLYTSLYMILLGRRGGFSSDDAHEFRRIVNRCWARSGKVLGRTYPGCLSRSPTKTDEQESWDDYQAVAYAGMLAGLPFARLMLAHARKFTPWWVPGGIWNNLVPGATSSKAWLGRSPMFMAHLRRCAYLSPCLWGPLGELQLAAALDGMRPEDSTGVINNWILTRLGPPTFRDWWRARAAGGRGDLPSDIMKRALSANLGADHPLAVYWI